MNGFKVFNPDWTCKKFQYEVGKTYEECCTPDICNRGFHFCKKAVDCFNYYSFNPANKVAEVIAHGEIVESSDQCATNKIEIVREIPWAELLELVNTGKANTGKRNSGKWNSGNRNSGNVNSGEYNSGDYNSGDYNSGDYNTGNGSSGYRNSGDYNSGYCNSGDYNSGYRNSGYCNSGDYNSGNYNSGYHNSGDCNSGNRNSGNRNSGNRNSGNRNSGDCNSGNWNTGNHNSGDWNKASFMAGCFNTESHDLLFFDCLTKMTFEEWRRSDACKIMIRVDFRPANWILERSMTPEEKSSHPDYETTGGYLKIRDNKDCFHEWWRDLTNDEKKIVKEIPNFNAEKFMLITGIDAT